MPEGTIKRLTDKGFGFIEDGSDKDMFFHSSNVEGTSFEQLQEGQRVSYTEGQGPKGPRAENVADLNAVTFRKTTKPTKFVGFFFVPACVQRS